MAERETMLEFAIWAGVRWRSSLIVTVNSGGKVYLAFSVNAPYHNTELDFETHHAQKASMKPSQEKVNTLP